MLALVCLSSPAFVYELMSQLIQTAIIKYHKPSDLRTTEIHFSQFWKLGSSSSRSQYISSVKAHFLVRRQVVVSMFCPNVLEEANELSEFSFSKVLIPFMRIPPTWTTHLLNASPPNTITMQVKIST
jgi:hypothetical protein